MKRLLGIAAVAAAIGMTFWAAGSTASAAEMARVRVVHASSDTPAVDVYADGNKVLNNVPFKGASDYLSVPAGAHNFKVYATGSNPATATPVINADVTLDAGTDHTIAAIGKLADIKPLVLTDDNSAPAAGKASVRVVHASPDAPAVDVAVKDGPVLFSNLAFGNGAGPAAVDAGTYDLQVRAAGTDTVALPLNGVQLTAGKIYTVFAVGLLNGTPPLEALTLVNDPAPAAAASPTAAAQPTTSSPGLPGTGSGSAADGSAAWPWFAVGAAAFGLALASAGAIAATRARSR